MTTQLDLTFRAAPQPAAAHDVQALIDYLDRNPRFHTARQLASVLNVTDRKVRQLAEAADGMIVSGPGSPGYCHLHHCPAEQIAHLTETLISQGRNMIKRALKTRNRAHGIIA